jgi:hypothetical protein
LAKIIIIGGDKGGTGKTTVARIVLDYLLSKSETVRAFDTEDRPVLARFFPDRTTMVDLAHTDGLMTVFDGLGAADVTLIDVKANLLTPALESLADIGLMDAVRAGRHQMLLLHVIGSSVASFAEISSMTSWLVGLEHVVVLNHINSADFFDWSPSQRTSLKFASAVIEIPQLDPTSYEMADVEGAPFSKFIADDRISMVLRGLVRTWLGKCYVQLAKVIVR